MQVAWYTALFICSITAVTTWSAPLISDVLHLLTRGHALCWLELLRFRLPLLVVHLILRVSNCVFLQLVEPRPGVGTSGQIARIRLENFMCHDNLEMELT